MSPALRVIVIGEGRDEHGKPRALPQLTPVPPQAQGALEILVRRALYRLLNDGVPWHRGLFRSDGIVILEPPRPRRPISWVEVLDDECELAPLVSGALRPIRGKAPADLLVLARDHDGEESALRAIGVVNRDLDTCIPLLIPVPEIQAWLASRRALELALGVELGSIPEVEEAALRRDAKAELKRLLTAGGGTFDAAIQARIAVELPEADLNRFPWNGWPEACAALELGLVAERARQERDR